MSPLASISADYAHIRHPRIRKVLHAWHAAAGDRLLPRRRDIDAVALRAELEIVWLYDTVWPGPRFRCRLSGERVNEVHGRSLVGRYLDEIVPAAARETIGGRYSRVVTERAVSHMAGRLYPSSGRSLSGERILLPLSDDGDTVDCLLGATAFDWTTQASGGPPPDADPIVTLTLIGSGRSQ